MLDALAGRLVPGSVVMFDENFNYHGWRRHEFRAWQEFVTQHRRQYRYRRFAGRVQQVYVVLL